MSRRYTGRPPNGSRIRDRPFEVSRGHQRRSTDETRTPLAGGCQDPSVLVLACFAPLRPGGGGVRGYPPVGARHRRPCPAVVVEDRRREWHQPTRSEACALWQGERVDRDSDLRGVVAGKGYVRAAEGRLRRAQCRPTV